MSWVATAVVGGAVIGAVGSGMAADKQSEAIEQSTDASLVANRESLDFQNKWLETNRSDIKAAIDQGLISLTDGYNMAMSYLAPFQGGTTPNYNVVGSTTSAPPVSLTDSQAIAYLTDPNNKDLMDYFDANAGNLGMSAVQYAKYHWETFGHKENRLVPGLVTSNAAGTTTGTTTNNAAGNVTYGNPTIDSNLATIQNLLSDPSAIMQRPSTQFAMAQGNEALQTAFSRTSGGGLSGPAIQAATEFGQNLASQSLDAEINRLWPMVNFGYNTALTKANLTTNYAANMANTRVGGATGIANVTGNAVSGISGTLQNQGIINSNAAINQGNVTTGLISNLSNTGSQFLNYAALNPSLFSSVKTTSSYGGGYPGASSR